MKVKNCLWLLGVFLLLQKMDAQIQPPDESTQHLLTANLGFDYNIVAANLSYGRYFANLKTAPFAEITQNTALLGLENFRLQTGIKSWLGSGERFVLNSSLALTWVKSTNEAGVYNGLGATVEVLPGVRLGRWALGAHLYLNPIVATHIEHSDSFRDTFYKDAKDGWYKSTATNLRAGAFLSWFANDANALEINLKSGYQTSGEFDGLIPNLYFLIGLNKRF